MSEHDLVEIEAGGLDYSLRNKLDTQYVRDMDQLVDRVRQVERLKSEKARVNRNTKERVAYVEMDDNDQGSDVEYNHVEENEVDLAELKPSPPMHVNFLHR